MRCGNWEEDEYICTIKGEKNQEVRSPIKMREMHSYMSLGYAVR
jgi:hypothetical protein